MLNCRGEDTDTILANHTGSVPLSCANQSQHSCLFTEPAILSGEQVAPTGHDGVVLWQWLRLSIHCCQTSDPEEVKWHFAMIYPSR